MGIIQELFNIVAPHECLGCQKEGSLLCYECSTLLSAVPSRCYSCGRWDDTWLTCRTCRRHTPIHSLWAVSKYEGVAKELLHSIKFERARAGAARVADMIASRVGTQEGLLVTYIPTAGSRVRERGYDQSRLIARGLAKRLGLPFSPCLLRSGQQRQLGSRRELRKQQMEGVFRPVGLPVFRGRHVLLVDDVLTTGATCEAAARTLRQAGACRVSAAVFAVA